MFEFRKLLLMFYMALRYYWCVYMIKRKQKNKNEPSLRKQHEVESAKTPKMHSGWKAFSNVRGFVLKENHKLRSSAIGIDGEAQGGPPRHLDAMAVVQGEDISLDFLKK